MLYASKKKKKTEQQQGFLNLATKCIYYQNSGTIKKIESEKLDRNIFFNLQMTVGRQRMQTF